MKKVVFDSSTLISLSDRCLINIIGRMAVSEGVEFVIPESVLEESVLYPLKIKKFELDAVRINNAIAHKWITVAKSTKTTRNNVQRIENIVNDICIAENRPMKIVHRGEIETIAIAKELGADAIAMDERTTRMLLEEPSALKEVLQHRLHRKIMLNNRAIAEFREFSGMVPIIRSVGLIALSYEKNYFGDDLPRNRTALEAALFAAKLSGCAVSTDEIRGYLRSVR